MWKSKIIGGGVGGRNIQMAFVILHCLLDFPISSTSCCLNKCLGVPWNEEASFHCFIAVNITAQLSEVIFSVNLAYEDSERNPYEA